MTVPPQPRSVEHVKRGTVLKAAAFDYVRAKTVAEALDLLVQHGDTAKLLAGGQSLLPALNLRLSAPAWLIDIGRISELRGVTVRGTTLRIGAMTTHAELAAAPDVARLVPMLVRAVSHIAHSAIRGRGTIGGSLANADPAAEMPACALALDARVIVQSPAGTRVIPAHAFFTGLFETALAPTEILVAIEIDASTAPWGFQELARRSGDYAIVGLAAQTVPGAAPRLAYFSVGATAMLAPQAALALAHGIDAACAALPQDLDPPSDLQASSKTRLALAQVLLRRVAGSWAERMAA